MTGFLLTLAFLLAVLTLSRAPVFGDDHRRGK